jgi:hypothetical protein
VGPSPAHHAVRAAGVPAPPTGGVKEPRVVHRGRVTLTATVARDGDGPGLDDWHHIRAGRSHAFSNCEMENPTGCLCMCMLELQLGPTERTAPKAPKPCLSVCMDVTSSPFLLLRHVCALDITVDTFSTNKSTIHWSFQHILATLPGVFTCR